MNMGLLRLRELRGEKGAQVGGDMRRDRPGGEPAAHLRRLLQGLGEGHAGLAALHVALDLFADLLREFPIDVLGQALEQFATGHGHLVLVIVPVGPFRASLLFILIREMEHFQLRA